MSSKAHSPKRVTIKSFAHEYLVKTSFVDIYGRNIGYDYSFILAEIKKQFPHARTTRRLLQDMAYILNRDERFPVRRRSRRALAEDYAMALLLRRNSRNVYRNVATAVKKKFPDHRPTLDRIKALDVWLSRKGFPIPPRTPAP